jgi:hypothetical protein
MVNSDIVVSFHHKVAMKHRLENNEIEKQLKCKICGVGLCFLGCFKEPDSVTGRGVLKPVYIHQQTTTKNVRILNFTVFKSKYLGLCYSSTSSVCSRFH